MLRRLYDEQPASFAFTPDNQAWAEAQIAKFPDGRQASAIIPLLWRAQEQEGWLSRPAIEHVADMLGLAHIRALEVATFYFMFQLQPVGSVAHIQICGTTSCMICGAEDLIGVCREKIAAEPHALSADGKFSWEEVECLGACSNAPMAQIGKDYYEDLTAEKLSEILDALARGDVPKPGPQNGRFASEPFGGPSSLTGGERHRDVNASVALAMDLGDTIKRIDGTETPLHTPWRHPGAESTPEKKRTDHLQPSGMPDAKPTPGPRPTKGEPVDETGTTEQETHEKDLARPEASGPALGPKELAAEENAPELLEAPRGEADDLTRISGVGPQFRDWLHSIGIWHFSQIAEWTEAEIDWVESKIEGPSGRVRRDEWVPQARELAKESKTER